MNWEPLILTFKLALVTTIILFVITFIVVLFGKLCLSESSSTTLVKASEMKGGQCPF